MSIAVWLCILGLMIALGIVVIGLIIWRIVNGQPTKSTQPLPFNFLDLEMPTPHHVYSEPVAQQPEPYQQSPEVLQAGSYESRRFKRCPSCGSTDVTPQHCNSCGKSLNNA